VKTEVKLAESDQARERDRAGLDSFFPVFSPQSGAACACETKPASMTIVKVASKRIADFMTCSL
jgi:hypothetical protein